MKNKSKYRVFFISVDAVGRPDEEKLLELPFFRFLTENSVFTDNVTTVFPTITYPIHTSAITGVYPENHNIFHNEPWQPDVKGNMRKWFWSLKEIGAETLWEAAAKKGLKVTSMLWPVSGKAYGSIARNFPEILPLPGENPTLKMLKYASPVWLAVTEKKWGIKVRKSIKREHLDDYMEFLSERLLEEKRIPDLFTVHFADTDFTRHDYGVGTPEDEAALIRMDKRLQKFFDAVNKKGLGENAVYVIMSDHGQENVREYIPLDSILSDTGNGRAQSVGMGALVYPEDYEKTLKYLTEHKPELHIETILEDKDLRSLRASKEVKLAVQSEPGFGYFDRNCEGDHKGDHGFGTDHDSAKTFLWLMGGPFKKGFRLEAANIVDLAPTISEVLGLNMKKCDGRVLTEAFKKTEKQ